jgi:hypothetical protein
VDGFQIEAADTTIKGLVIRRFDDYGIQMSGTGATGNKVEGNFIGVNRDGITGRGNSIGVFINGGDDNTVGGLQPEMRNVISANDEHGVFIGGLLSGGNENRVEGNYIGTTADGDADLGNAEIGVFISGASNNTIGGTAEGARNVISANEFGVFITGFQATENRVEGNYIGTTADGDADLGNSIDGVAITTAPDNTVGGTVTGPSSRLFRPWPPRPWPRCLSLSLPMWFSSFKFALAAKGPALRTRKHPEVICVSTRVVQVGLKRTVGVSYWSKLWLALSPPPWRRSGPSERCTFD